jgi:acyl-coenzyme A synthetase/AMP-(fatty) acid ligase
MLWLGSAMPPARVSPQQPRNFARDVVGAADPRRTILIEIDRAGHRRAWSAGEVSARAGALAGALAGAGVRPGDPILTLIGNRPEWAFALLAAFQLGAVVVPCSEQLRAADLAMRLGVLECAAIVADERNREQLEAAGADCPILWTGEEAIWRSEAPEPVALEPAAPALMTFTSGTTGTPKCVVHNPSYLWGQVLQAEYWMGIAAGDVVWCTAASGWSKSARNALVAPWLRGAVAVLHDGRFDPAERLAIVAQEQVRVLCMAPTEYRTVLAAASPTPFAALRECVAAGEALDAETIGAWRAATGIELRDGYGQTETGQVTATPHGTRSRPGSMGKPLPGIRAWIDDGELVVDPASVPTFFRGYLGEPAPTGPWRTGDRVREEDGYLYFEGRADDVIISSGYRIGPVEVESTLLRHPAVSEVAVVGEPDARRGSVVRAVVVLRPGYDPGPERARELQEFAKSSTAPYKYPRIVEFAAELPRGSSGKVRRAALRSDGA